jgi:hypothetical protein
VLLNNLAFALAHQGKVTEAEAALRRVKPGAAQGGAAICLLATRGLVAYRAGDAPSGKALYLQAIEEARNQKQAKMEARASLNLACEELRVNSPAVESAVKEAIELSKPMKEGDVSQVLRRLKRALEMKAEAGSAFVPYLEVLTKLLDKSRRR